MFAYIEVLGITGFPSFTAFVYLDSPISQISILIFAFSDIAIAPSDCWLIACIKRILASCYYFLQSEVLVSAIVYPSRPGIFFFFFFVVPGLSRHLGSPVGYNCLFSSSTIPYLLSCALLALPLSVIYTSIFPTYRYGNPLLFAWYAHI